MEIRGEAFLRPPILDGTNYAYWKERIRAYIKAIDEKAWKAILVRWEHPTKMVDDEKILKPEQEWTHEEDRQSNYNSKALNAIFAAVDPEIFRMISTCRTAYDAWEVLQTHHEGTKQVKESRLQMLTTRFETLVMSEDENIAQFSSKIRDIANEAFALGKEIPENELVKKVLRSLPSCFAVKVAAIEEAKDVNTIKLAELLGSLQTFELKFKKKDKGIAFKAKTREPRDEVSDEENLEDSIELLTKKVDQLLKHCNKKKTENFKRKTMSKPSSSNPPTSSTARNKMRKGKCRECGGFGHFQNECAQKVKCRECSGYGHLQNDCPNLKGESQSFNANWSEEEESQYNSDESEEYVTSHVVFNVTDNKSVETCVETGSVTQTNAGNKDDYSEEDELDMKEIEETYRQMHKSWVETLERNKALEGKIQELVKGKETLETTMRSLEGALAEKDGKIKEMQQELDNCSRIAFKMKTSTEKLDQVLSMGKRSNDNHGIGYVDTKGASMSTTTFVRSSSKAKIPSPIQGMTLS